MSDALALNRVYTDPNKKRPAPPRLRDMDESAVRAELRAARRVIAAARRRMPGDARECQCWACQAQREIREAIWDYDATVDAERARLARWQRPLDLATEAAG